MSSILRISGAFAAALLAGGMAAGAAQAADPPLSNADPTRGPPPADAAAPAETRAARPPEGLDSGVRFVLRGVTFEGASRPDLLANLSRPYVGREVGAGELREIAILAEDAYDRAGLPYVSVRALPQEVADGVVHFQVIEGRVTRLTVLGADPVARRQAAGAFAGLKRVNPLSRADLEAAYAEAGRVPGLVVTAAFGPGERPGDMDLVVQARRKPWSVYANVNNYYPEATGPWGISLGVRHAGDSPYGDAFDLTLYSTSDFQEQQAIRLGYRRRLDAEGTEVGAALLYADGEPDPAITFVSYASTVWIGRLDAWKPLWKDGRARLDAGLAFDWIDQKSQLPSAVTLSDDHLRVADLGLRAEWRGRAWLRGELHLRKGLSIAGASDSSDPNLSRFNGDPQAWVARGRLEGETARFGPLKLYGRVDWQTTDDPLLFPEQYSGGSFTIGRGYEPGAAIGDKALGGTAELRFGPWNVGVLGKLSPFAFYDRAEVQNVDAFSPKLRLSSYGAGFRLEKPGRWRASLTWTKPEDPLIFAESNTLLFDFTTSLDGLFGLSKGPRS